MWHKGCGGFVTVQREQTSVKRMGDGVDAGADLAMDATGTLSDKGVAAEVQVCREAGGAGCKIGVAINEGVCRRR